MPDIPRPLKLACLPLVFGLGACASAASGPMLLPAGWVPPTGQHCTPLKAPVQLPAVGEITDSARLVQQLAGQTGYGLFTLGYDSLGVADTVQFAGGDVPEASRAAWLRAVSASQRERSPIPLPTRRGKPHGWAVLLRIDAGSSPAARIGRAEHCIPVLSNRLAVESHMDRAAATFLQRNPFQSRPTRVTVQMSVDAGGRVTRATAVRTEAVPELTRIAEETAMQMRFLPARLNRIPVESTVRIPLTFQFARR